MKRALVVMVILLAMVAFVSGGMAQAPAKTEKPAVPAPEKAAPAPTPEKVKPVTEKSKEEKPGAVRFSGTVTGYEAGKMIKVKGPDDKETTFGVTKKTKVKGEMKEGAKVTIAYKKEGDKMVATGITVAGEKKPPKTTQEKASEKAPVKK